MIAFMRSIFFVGALALCAGCGVARVPPEPAWLQVIATPVHAVVYVDDHFFGTGRVLRMGGKRLAQGVHFITVQASGYFPHDVQLRLPGGLTKVKVSLRRIPQG